MHTHLPFSHVLNTLVRWQYGPDGLFRASMAEICHRMDQLIGRGTG